MTETAIQPTDLEAASFSYMLSSVLTAVSRDPLGTAEHHAVQRDAAAASLVGLRPHGPVQHMLAARTVAAHFAAMDAFRRSGSDDATDEVIRRERGMAFTMSRLADTTHRSLEAHQLTPNGR